MTELFQIEIDAVIYTDQFTCFNKKQPSKGWSGVHLLHDNTSSRTCEVVKFCVCVCVCVCVCGGGGGEGVASEKMKVLYYPPYSSDLSPCDFFLFPRLKKMLSGNKYTSRSSLGSTIYQCLQQIPKEDYKGSAESFVTGFRLLQCYVLSNIFLLQTFKVVNLY